MLVAEEKEGGFDSVVSMQEDELHENERWRAGQRGKTDGASLVLCLEGVDLQSSYALNV